MARIRTVKPEFWTDETMAEVSRDARLLFLALLNHADDEGRCVDNARLIKAAAFPLDDDVTADMVRRWLDELSSKARIIPYECSDKRFLQIAHFSDHQKIDRKSASRLPAPTDGTVRETAGQGAFDETSSSPRRMIVEPSLPDLGSSTSFVASAPPTAEAVDDGFEEFWNQYPRRDGVRKGKAKAHVAWRRIATSKRPDVMRALSTYSAACNGYPQDAQRWLVSGVWDEWLRDDVIAASTPAADERKTRIRDGIPEVWVAGSGWARDHRTPTPGDWED